MLIVAGRAVVDKCSCVTPFKDHLSHNMLSLWGSKTPAGTVSLASGNVPGWVKLEAFLTFQLALYTK